MKPEYGKRYIVRITTSDGKEYKSVATYSGKVPKDWHWPNKDCDYWTDSIYPPYGLHKLIEVIKECTN